MMAWEHSLLGDLDPARISATAAGDTAPLAAYCDQLTELGLAPREADAWRLSASGLPSLQLPGSGLVITLGELNYLPDYLGTPTQIERAPARFVGPLIQSVRSWSIAELRWPADGWGRDGGGGWGSGLGLALLRVPRLLPGALRYPLLGALAETAEISAVDSLGRGCGFAPQDQYSAVLARNAGHFAPFSWYRWHSFHLAARELIARSGDADATARETLRMRARIYAGYGDHFLQDSFAAGHQINKTLIMQWYLEWLELSGVPYPGKEVLAALTAQRQPLLHGPGLYDRAAARASGSGNAAAGTAGAALDGAAGRVPGAPWDPQDLPEVPTLAERIAASGVTGDSDAELRAAYAAYMTMLSNGPVQLAVKVAHEYLNKRSLVVASAADGPAFRIYGDHTMLASSGGADRAATAAAASRRAIAELLETGSTSVSSWEIFDSFPSHVEQGGRLVTLSEWHAGGLRDLCFGELFPRWSTRAMHAVMSASVFRQFGTPAPEADLRA